MLLDDIDAELFELLSTKIGMMVEDHGALVLIVGSEVADEPKTALQELAQTADKLNVIIAAAQSLVE